MKKYVMCGILAFIAALLGAIFPSLLSYVRFDHFDIAAFLEDNPKGYWIIDTALWCSFVVFIVLAFISARRAVTIVQTSKTYGQGSESLISAFERNWISKSVIEIDDNIPVVNPSDQDISSNIERIKTRLEEIKGSQINYLAIAHIPLMVKAGFLLGNDGYQVHYFVYCRAKEKVKMVPSLGKSCNSFTKTFEHITHSKDLLIMVESSYKMNLVTPSTYFEKMDEMRFTAKTVGTDNIKNTNTLKTMAHQVREAIDKIAGEYETIHLVLCTNAPLSFAIGQQLNSTNMPKIVVYEYSNQPDVNRPWGIQINKENNEILRPTKFGG